MMDLLVDYLEGDLDETETERLEFHLDLCPPCVNFLESYRETGKICREALRREMPGELRERLHEVLARECCEKDSGSAG
jgi:anti-sigma factor RsiW